MFRSPEKRRMIACGLILAAPFVAGCGTSGLDEEKKIKADTQKNVKALEKTFNPAMARIGRRAVKFIYTNPYEGFIYRLGNSKNISISRDDGYDIDISLKRGVKTSDIKNGDVESIIIRKDKSDRRAQELRIEPAQDNSGVCAKGGLVASSERFDTSSEENDLVSFITTNRCNGEMLNPNFDEPSQDLTSVDAAKRIVNEANLHFNQATKSK